jgi:hypothetical protein
MSRIVDGIMTAFMGLSKEDKKSAVAFILSDPDIRETILGEIYTRLQGALARPIEPTRTGSVDGGTVGSTPLVLDKGKTILNDELTEGRKRTFRNEARLTRREYLTDIRKSGIAFDQTGEIWIQTESGYEVAIPVATERQPYRWFLGIDGTKIQKHAVNNRLIIVLLCKKENRLVDIVLAPDDVKKLLPYFSKQYKTGNYLFNVKLEANRYYLGLPGAEPQDVTQNIHKISVLKQAVR